MRDLGWFRAARHAFSVKKSYPVSTGQRLLRSAASLEPPLHRLGLPGAGRVVERRAFVAQQPALALQAAAEAGEGAVGADDAVAGDDDRDRVGAVGQPDRAHGLRLPDGGGELALPPG